MAQHATLAHSHHGGHEPYAPTPHHVLAAAHHPVQVTNGGALPSHQQQQHQHHQQQHSMSAPRPSQAQAASTPRQAEFYAPSQSSFYPPNHHSPSLSSPHHMSPHPPASHPTAASSATPGPPQMPSAGPSSLRTSPSAPNTGLEWSPSASSSQDRRQSVPLESGYRSQLPSPDPPLPQRTSEILMQQQGVRTSDSFLARATNEHLVMHDRPMARRPSDLGGPPDEDDGRVGVEDPCESPPRV